MSYNFLNFKVKAVSLTLPLGFKMEEFTDRYDKEKIAVASDLKNWSFREEWEGEGLTLKGTVTPEGLKVSEISCEGTGSGHDFEDVLKPLFAKFQGDLKAKIVGEDGER